MARTHAYCTYISTDTFGKSAGKPVVVKSIKRCWLAAELNEYAVPCPPSFKELEFHSPNRRSCRACSRMLTPNLPSFFCRPAQQWYRSCSRDCSAAAQIRYSFRGLSDGSSVSASRRRNGVFANAAATFRALLVPTAFMRRALVLFMQCVT